MKKIYTLATFLLATTTATYAQKVIDLEVTQVKPAPGTVVTVGTSFDYEVIFKNKGTGAIAPADTIGWTFTGLNGYYPLTGYTKAMNDTIWIKTTVNFTAAPNGPMNFCTYALAFNGSTITDSDTSNNRSCDAITITGGTNSIQNITASFGNKNLESFTVSPNPAVNYVTLGYTANSATNVTARVTDVTGRTVMTQDFGKAYNGKSSFKLDVSGLNSGIYFIELNENGRRAVSKMIKQ